MPTLKLMVADPFHRRIELGDSELITLGVPQGVLERLLAAGGAADEEIARICSSRGNCIVMRIGKARGKPAAIRIWKGITSDHDVFYTVRPGGDFLLSDSFRNILAGIPARERYVPEAAVADHMLFRTVPGDTSYCRDVRRLGHGEELFINLQDGTAETRLFDRFTPPEEDEMGDRYLEKVDEAIAAEAELAREVGGVVNLFSGGVDSVLLQWHLGPEVPALTGILERRLEQFETAYANIGADVLGIHPQTFDIPSSEYAEDLTSAVRGMGIPPRQDQEVLYDRAFRHDFSCFVSGETADAVFGSDTRAAKLASYFRAPAWSYLLRHAILVAPGAMKNRLSTVLINAQKLSLDPMSITGYAGLTNVWTDMEALYRTFGRETVEERLNRRLEYVLRRIDLTAPKTDPFLRHLELSHWMSLLTQDAAMMHRQLALGRGRHLITPFAARPVVNACTSAPLSSRYVDGIEAKPILKNLVRRHLPAYPAAVKKGHTLSPLYEFFTKGPLSDVWQRYKVPDCFRGEVADGLLHGYSYLNWNAAVFAVWRDEVLKNDHLTECPATETYQWDDSSVTTTEAAAPTRRWFDPALEPRPPHQE